MIALVLVVAVAYFAYHLIKEILEENACLKGQSLSQKISRTVQIINDKVYNGHGDIIATEKKAFTLQQQGGNQIIHFQYETGELTITLALFAFSPRNCARKSLS